MIHLREELKRPNTGSGAGDCDCDAIWPAYFLAHEGEGVGALLKDGKDLADLIGYLGVAVALGLADQPVQDLAGLREAIC